jgi:hypothetical protein
VAEHGERGVHLPLQAGVWNVTMNNNLTFTIGEADAGRLFSEITVRPRD